MIDLDVVMKEANTIYCRVKPYKTCMESQQIRALAIVLVKHFNIELEEVEKRLRILETKVKGMDRRYHKKQKED